MDYNYQILSESVDLMEENVASKFTQGLAGAIEKVLPRSVKDRNLLAKALRNGRKIEDSVGKVLGTKAPRGFTKLLYGKSDAVRHAPAIDFHAGKLARRQKRFNATHPSFLDAKLNWSE